MSRKPTVKKIEDNISKLGNNMVDIGKQATSEMWEKLSTTKDFYGKPLKFWVNVQKFISVALLVLYLVIVWVIWKNGLLLVYGPQLWLSPIPLATFAIFAMFYTTGEEKAGHYSALTTLSLLIMAVLVLGMIVCHVLFMIKWGMDANLCAAVRDTVTPYNWVTAPSNTTSTGLGYVAASPIVCVDPNYGQFVTIATIQSIMAALTLGYIVTGLFISYYGKVWNLILGRVMYLKSNYDENTNLEVNPDAVEGDDDDFYSELDRVSGRTDHGHKRVRHSRGHNQPYQPVPIKN